MARSNPSSAQYQLEVMGCGAPIGKAKTPPGRSARYTPANSAGRSAGQEVPERPETDRQAEGPGEGQGPDVGPYPPSVRVRTARLREHAPAEVDAGDLSQAHGSEDPHARAGAAAHVQSPAERAERAQRAGGRVKHAIGCAKRCVVELRSKPVVAALDRGQLLPRQFTHRRAFRREHRLRVLLRSDLRVLRGHRGPVRTRIIGSADEVSPKGERRLCGLLLAEFQRKFHPTNARGPVSRVDQLEYRPAVRTGLLRRRDAHHVDLGSVG